MLMPSEFGLLRYFIPSAICWLVPALVNATETPSFSIVGYLPSYRVDRFREEQARKLTDVILFAVEPRADGSLDDSRITAEVMRKVDRQLEGLRVRKLLTVGGWGRSDAFATVTADPKRRSRLVDELVRMCDRHGLAGIDVDWEHPASAAEYAAYTQFLQELHGRLAPQKRIVTAAIAPWKIPPAEAFAYIDRVHLMAYDNGGRHSTFDLAFDSVDKLLKLDVPAKKICLGIPFYGRPYEGEFGKATIYRDIVRRSKLKPADNETDGVFFNGPELVARKVGLARRLDLAGVMMWEIGQDVADPQQSLLYSIHQAATASLEPDP
jgi:chitinase